MNTLSLKQFLLVGSIFLLAACGERKAKELLGETNVDEKGLYFIKTALESGNKEIATSKLAQQKATNARVRSFADMMIHDHTATAAELLKVSDKKLVTPTDSLTPGQRITMDSLGKFSGAAFDKAYMQLMVKDHEQAVALFEFGTTNRIKTVKDFAEKKLPALQMHLDSAKSIAAGLK